MTSDYLITSDLIHKILDAPERHAYVRSDNLHAGRAIALISGLARIREDTQDHPTGAHFITVPSFLPARRAPASGTTGQARRVAA